MEPQKTTVTAPPEIPEIKLAGVQKREEDRKRGGGAYFRTAGAGRGGFAGAMGGAGRGGGFLANLFAQIGQNIGVFGFVAAVAVAAAGYGRLRAPEYQAYKNRNNKSFATHEKQGYSGNVSRLPTNRPSGGDSLSMISGSLDGKTQAERDKEAADAAAKAKADADAKAKEEADAKAKEDAAAKAPDPNAALQAAMAGQPQQQAPQQEKGLGHGKIGSLSTALGGAGLSGGAGMSGGIGGAFSNNKFDANKLLAMKAVPQAAKTSGPATASYRGIGRGKALRQLDKVAHYSNLARTGANESRSTNASAPFDNSVPGGDRITGAGARDGTSPKDSQTDSNPAPNSPGQGGSPLTNTNDDGLTDCGNGVRAPAGQCPQTQDGHDVDPTTSIVSMLKMLMWIVAGLSIIQYLYVHFELPEDYAAVTAAAAATPFSAPALAAAEAKLAKDMGMWSYLKTIIGGLGIGIATLGILLMTMGRPILGGIYAAIGALTAIASFSGWMGYNMGTMAIASTAMAGITQFLNNPDHKTAGPGGLKDGGGGWF